MNRQISHRDFESLDEFGVGESQSYAPQKNYHPTKQSRNVSGKEHLGRLIEQDIERTVHAGIFLRNQDKIHQASHYSANAAQAQPSRSTHRQSSHILDLRKHYLIEKYQLNELRKPAPSFFETIRTWLRNRSSKNEQLWILPQPTQSAKRRQSKPRRESAIKKISSTIHWLLHAPQLTSYAGVLIALIFLMPAARVVFNLQSNVSTLYTQTARAFSTLQDGLQNYTESNPDEALKNLQRAREAFSSLQSSLANYNTLTLNIIENLPVSTDYYALAKHATSLGRHTSDFGLALGPYADTKAELQISNSTPYLIAASNASIALRSIASDIASIRKILESINTVHIEQATALPAADVLNAAASLERGVNQAQVLFEVFSSILGEATPTRVLFLFQNSRELRPTGGFIGSYAVIEFSKGKAVATEFPDGGSYDLTAGMRDHLIPPQPLQLVNQEWYLWDANWWPDYPTSAEKISTFYERATGRSVHAVIAVNSDLLESILSLTGPITMPAYTTSPITAENFYDVLQLFIEDDYKSSGEKPKAILRELLPEIVTRLTSAASVSDVLGLLSESFAKKDIQIYIHDAVLQGKLRAASIDGSVFEAPRDFLMAVSTNIAGGKTDSYIYQTTEHEARVTQSGEVYVTVTISKEHRAPESDPFGHVPNLDFIRLYVPRGSQYVESDGFFQPPADLFHTPLPNQTSDEQLMPLNSMNFVSEDHTIRYDELGKTVFANWIRVEPGNSAKARITYKLPFRLFSSNQQPAGVLAFLNEKPVDNYSILFQKQSGKKNEIILSRVILENNRSIVWSVTDETSSFTANQTTAKLNARFEQDAYFALLIADNERAGP